MSTGTSYIKRITAVGETDEKGYEVSLALECGHVLGLATTHYSPKLVAYWCPMCRHDAEQRFAVQASFNIGPGDYDGPEGA